MFYKLRKIDKRKDGVYFLNELGYVVKIPNEDFDIVMKYAKRKNITSKMPNIIKELADAKILYFNNYSSKDNLEFDDSLVTNDNEDPIYKAPIIAHLSVTNACNMNCLYCSVRSIHQKNKQPSLEECKIMIDKLVDWGVFQIGLTGGEPTVRKDLVELVRYVSSKQVACNLTTNGFNVSAKLVDDLVAAGLTQVQLSLDSHIKEEHERYRNKGSYEKVLKTAKLFKNKGLIVGFDTVVTNDNLDKIKDMIIFLEKQNFDGLTLLKLKKGDLDLETYQKLVPDYHKYASLIDDICHYNGNLDVTLDCGSVCNLCKTLTKEEANNLHSAGCPAGHTLIHIDCNGDMYPCAGLSVKELKLGNLLTDDPSYIWNNNLKLKQMRNIKRLVIGKCSNCDKLNNCRAGCRAISYAYGNLLNSDPTCAYLDR